MTPAQVIALLPNPEALMRRVNLVIAGGATRSPTLPNAPAPPANGQAVIATFQVSMKGYMSNGVFVPQVASGFTTGLSGLFGRRKNRPIAQIRRLPGPAVAAPAADQFNAYYVPMVQTSDVGLGTSHYSLPTVGGPDVMITSQLSGCSFGVGSSAAGAVLVSHVQPDAAVAAPNRAADLANNLRAGFANVRGTASKSGLYDEFAAIIGVRSNAVWRFYLQAYDASGPQTVVTHAMVI